MCVVCYVEFPQQHAQLVTVSHFTDFFFFYLMWHMPFVNLNGLSVCSLHVCTIHVLQQYVHLLLNILPSILYRIDISCSNVAVTDFNSQ